MHSLKLAVLFAFTVSSLQSQIVADTILVHGKIWTENPAQPEAQALAILGDRIVAVSTDEAIQRARGPHTVVVDLQGRRVTPGFNDAHVHFIEGGSALASVQLRESSSQQDFRDRLAQFARTQPQGVWIQGGEWDHERWSPAELPTHELIDPVTSENPVFVERLDGHMALANAAAMRAAGVDKNTPDVPGGVIVRDSSGNPTGIFKDAAQNLIIKAIPLPDENQRIVAAAAAEAYAVEHGVTSVQDMSCGPETFRAYQDLLRDHKLQVRISCHQPLRTWQRLSAPGIQAIVGNEWLHIGGLKGFADGSLGSTTAWFFKPYLDAPQTSGIASDELSKPSEMFGNMQGADRAGLQVATHAIGDRANNTILNFYQRIEEEDGPRDRRFRIEHAQHLLPADIPRFHSLHVIASMQPYHCIDDGRWAAKRLDPERLKTTHAYRALLDSGATLAFGSDWPVAPMIPLQGIYAAVTRRTLDGKNPQGWIPEQKISVAEAVHAYTVGAAYAESEESIKGSLSPGKLADLVVLSEDIFHIDPVKIWDTRVDMTFTGGKLTFHR